MPPVKVVDGYDVLIVGSGFGGSVAALRLAEKGYRVAVLEAGKRFATEDFPLTNWNLRRSVWMPKLFCHGILRLTLLSDVLVGSGAGVGGGSLVYANTLPVPRADVFRHTEWPSGRDWEEALAPHYVTAKRMLGAATNPRLTEADRVLRECAEEIGKGGTFRRTDVAVFFGEPGEGSPTPTSAARVLRVRAVCFAEDAWSAAATTPRTRWTRTTSTWPRSAGRGSFRKRRWTRSGRKTTVVTPSRAFAARRSWPATGKSGAPPWSSWPRAFSARSTSFCVHANAGPCRHFRQRSAGAFARTARRSSGQPRAARRSISRRASRSRQALTQTMSLTSNRCGTREVPI